MSKFCKQCGNQMADNEVVCASCGASQEPIPQNIINSAAAEEGKSKSGNGKFIAVIVAIVVIILIVLKLIFGTAAYEKPLKNFFEGIEDKDGDKIEEAFPEFYGDKMTKLYDFDDVADELYDRLEDEFGKNIKISYKIKDKEKIDKDDLEDIEEEIKDDYDEKVKVSKGYELELKLKVKGKKDKDEHTSELEVYKIDGDWYIMRTSF